MGRQAVAGLTSLGSFTEALKELGGAPAPDAIGDRDYERLGAAFIARLERSLKQPMAEAMRDSWQEVFRLLAETGQSLAPAA